LAKQVRIMPPIPTPRIALPVLALTAASGAALISGILYERQPSVETRSATTAAAVAATAGSGEEGSAAYATAVPPAVSPGLTHSGDAIVPAFEFALVGRAGDAVIAGTAAPGAAVELLRNGEPLDQAIADHCARPKRSPAQTIKSRCRLASIKPDRLRPKRRLGQEWQRRRLWHIMCQSISNHPWMS
jgi:hypothetical protein